MKKQGLEVGRNFLLFQKVTRPMEDPTRQSLANPAQRSLHDTHERISPPLLFTWGSLSPLAG